MWRVVGGLVLRSTVTVVALFVAYALLPGTGHSSGAKVGVFVLAMAGLALMVVLQVRAILGSSYPGLRAVEALVIIVPFFLLAFSLTYLTMSQSNAHTFNVHLDHVRAFYFSTVVFATVGFGDIVPKTDPARLVVTIQIVLDLVLIGGVIRLLITAVQRNLRGRQGG